MAPLRSLLAAGLTTFCVSCSSDPTAEGDRLDLPPPPPPVFPVDFRPHDPPSAPREDPEPAVWSPCEDPRGLTAPPAHPPADLPREEVRPAATQIPTPPATIEDAASTLERKLALDPNARELRRQLVHLYLASGDWPRADQHMAMLPVTTFEDRLLAACIAYRIGGPENRTALRMLSEAQRDLADVLPFEFRTAQFCEPHIPKVGQFRALEKAEFVPAENVCVYLSFDNFALEEIQDQFQVHLGFEYRILDRGGNTIPWSESARDRKEFQETYRERVRDLCVPLLLTWPRHIGSGDYTLEVTVTDRIGRKSATQRIDFRIK